MTNNIQTGNLALSPTYPDLANKVAVVTGGSLFLASDNSSWLTGITLDVAGGRVML